MSIEEISNVPDDGQMPEKAKKPAKAKSSKIEIERRMRIIQQWILDDYSFSDIVTSAISRFNVEERQAQRYYSDAYKRFRDGNQQDIENKKAYYISKLKNVLQNMDPREKKRAAGATAIMGIIETMAKLDGISMNKVELSGKDGGPIGHTVESTVIFEDMSEPKDNSTDEDI